MLRPAATAGCLALCVSAALYAEQALAADWRVAPSAYIGTSYADNPRLLTEGARQSAGALGEFNAYIQRLTERSSFSLTPKLRSTRYSDDESLNTDDQYLNARYRWFSEHSEWNSEIGLTRDTTLTSEVGLTGLVESNRPHRAITISAGPTFMVSERASIGGQLYSVDNHYSDVGSTGLVDYSYRAVSASFNYATSDRSSIAVAAQGGELGSGGAFGVASRDASLKLSWNYQPYDLWRLTVSAGPSYAESDLDSDVGSLFEFEAQRRGDLWSLTTSAGRSLTPTGRGVMMRRDRVSLSLRKDLAEKFEATLGAQWIRSEDLLGQLGIDSEHVDYARIDLTGYWRVAQHWSLALQLTGITQERERSTQRADSYRALLSMVWNGLPLSL